MKQTGAHTLLFEVKELQKLQETIITVPTTN